MGLAAELGYVHPRPNAAQRSVQAVASTRPGAWLFSKTAPRLDRILLALSGGRTTLARLVAGLAVLELATTGRRSGRQRTTRLVAVPLDETLALLGTNFGQRHSPAWVLNLEADPRATVTFRGATRRVVARPATDAERDRVLVSAAAVYDGYARYQKRITDRRLRVFVLEAAG